MTNAGISFHILRSQLMLAIIKRLSAHLLGERERQFQWSTLNSQPELKRRNGENQSRPIQSSFISLISKLVLSLFCYSFCQTSMGSFLFFFTSFLFLTPISGISFLEFIHPDFTASYFQFIDNHGTFLSSRSGMFKASIFNPGAQQMNFYLCVIHVASNTIIWSANHDAPISSSGKMNLTVKGITIADQNGNSRWSTPPLQSSVHALLLTEMGNLVLLDQFNASLWESFHHPTDTLVIGQHLPAGSFLSSALSADNLSTGDYRLIITGSDAVMQWHEQTYWKLSMQVIAFVNSNYAVEYMAINRTGLYLFGQNDSLIVIQVPLPPTSSNIRIAKLTSFGQFTVTTFSADGWKQEFVGPVDGCQIPFICGRVGLCTNDATYSNPTCSCPANFHSASDNITGCVPSDQSFSLPFACNSTLDGSITLNSADENVLQGYIKALVLPTDANGPINHRPEFPVAALVLLPFTGFFLLAALGFLCWRRGIFKKNRKLKFGHSVSSQDLDAFCIPGLPQRFDYEELEVATDNFKTQIGSGGFGSVYKGILPDKSVVAVKKITNLGVQGKKDFCTEIAVIGNIHHVNLVKLRGFCAQGGRRLLVYEYMNRGSLDRTLFGSGPVIEWQERFDIALGTARALAYLHCGCEQKIIHCDVKPENILLHDHFQPKISDFGLSKLLSPEQSSLFTTMRGTRGYLAPEWLTNSAISEKTDVYSFGMVLLELVSGRKNCLLRSPSHCMDDENSSGSQSSSSGSRFIYFPLYALEMHEQGRYLELADTKLEGRVMSEEVEKLVCIALCCVHEEPSLRPNMVTVVGMLEGRIPVTRPRMESLNFLRFYGRRFSEASTIEEEERESDVMLYQQANASCTSSASGSQHYFSYISSQQISGPR
ncbi:G-type lectin S-receptor-like serine/threonine-protein kinase At5g35370 [Carica papaya]|uniref:G-type lectin S-receptor-like serine/threonine-protein kinase At5g35370 n=1 Tax=Carica papaya TaxID=3649 RepID=UPI000B8CCD7C|nr:G-type lectin S-receptor-like serine/threonine-protein kinase At5g35370 [Carica papaya]